MEIIQLKQRNGLRHVPLKDELINEDPYRIICVLHMLVYTVKELKNETQININECLIM